MKSKYYKRWLLQAPLGLIIIGFGVCLIAEAAMVKYDNAPVWQWVSYGTIALVVFNSGLCIFGDSIIQRVHFEQLKREENS